MKRFLLTVLVLTAIFSIAFADTQTVTLQNGNANTLTISNQSWQGFSLDVNVAEITLNSVQTPWGNFTRVMLPNCEGWHLEEGKAFLPSINQLIDIPYDADVVVEVAYSESEEISLNNYGFIDPVLPYQGSIEKTEDAAQNHVFQMDNNYYSASEYQTFSLAEYKEIGNMRGHRLGQVLINAVEYLPVENKIRVHKNIQIRVTFLNANISLTESIHKKYNSPYFNSVFQTQVLNFAPTENDLTRYPVHYAIIYFDAFESALQPFIEWKEQKGFMVTAERISQIGNNISSITTYITGLYNSANPPSFVLLVGDKAQVETSSGQTGSHVTDLYYTTMTTGDFVPDIYIGRLSAQTESQLNAQLDKILPYEKYQLPQTAFLNHGSFIATDDQYLVAEGTHNYVINTHFIPNNLLYDKLYAITYGSSGADVISALNAGRFILNYSGHGSTTSWGGPSVSQSMVNSSTNADMYPFVISNACLTGSFEVTECFGETWVRKANGGGLAFTGASNSTYWDEDDDWERRAYDGVFWENYYSLSAFIFRGNLGVLNAGYSRAKYYFEVYHLFGDPSLMLYWGEPTQMTVNNNSVVPIGSSEFIVDVTGEDSALVALYMNGELYGTALTNSSGSATVQFTIPPTTVGDMFLTVTKFNRQPYIDTLQVIVPSYVSVQPDTIPINTATLINITVMDSDTLNPEPGVRIWAEGVGYVSDTTMTDSSGMATLTVNYPFGPELYLNGKRPADNYYLFNDTLVVSGGMMLNGSDLWVSTDFGLNDKFAKNLAGTLHKNSLTAGTALYYRINESEWNSTNVDSITFTPGVNGNVTGVIAKTGYDIYTENFPIITAYGTLSGVVFEDTAATPMSNITVRVYDDTILLGTATTNGLGEFTYPDSLPVANYQIKIGQFGYLSIDSTLFVGYGPNSYSFTMQFAPSGTVSGTITEDGTTLPIEAVIKMYRADNLQLYHQTMSDSLGNYSLTLPFFSYKMVVSSMGYKSSAGYITVNSLNQTVDVTLVPGVDDYVYDFENNNGGFTGTSSWAWGSPSSGPNSAYQGVNVWATNLTGEYGNNEHAELTTLTLDLTGFNNPKLQFTHWYDIEEYYSTPGSAWDGGNVKISTDDGSTYQILTPLGGYPYTISASSNAMNGQAVYSGTSIGWELAEFDLAAYVEQQIILKFDFSTDGSVTEAGWYIDSVVVNSEPIMPSAPINLAVMNNVEAVDLCWQDATKNLLNENLDYMNIADPQKEEIAKMKELANIGNINPVPENPKSLHFNVYKSQDGASFSMMETTLDTTCTDSTVTVGETYYYYVTSSMGALESEPSDTVMVTIDPFVNGIVSDNEIPTKYALNQNYPNPFNPNTNIKFSLPKTETVTLRIYNVIGQVVATLVNEKLNPGNYTYNWDAKGFASGLYYLKMEAGSFAQIRKMILMK